MQQRGPVILVLLRGVGGGDRDPWEPIGPLAWCPTRWEIDLQLVFDLHACAVALVHASKHITCGHAHKPTPYLLDTYTRLSKKSDADAQCRLSYTTVPPYGHLCLSQLATWENRLCIFSEVAPWITQQGSFLE